MGRVSRGRRRRVVEKWTGVQRCCLTGFLLAGPAFGAEPTRNVEAPPGGAATVPAANTGLPAAATPPASPTPTATAAPGRPARSAPLPLAPAPASFTETETLERTRAKLAERLRPLTPSGTEPCTLHAWLELGRETLVACGSGGVWVLELRPAEGDRLVQRQAIPGRAVGLFSRNGRVWVEIETLSARPLHEVEPEATVPASRESAPRAPPSPPLPLAPLPLEPQPGPTASDRAAPVAIAILGRVVTARAGRLVIDLGARHGARVGGRVELAIAAEGRIAGFHEREVLAVATIVSVTDEQSLVELGTGEEVPVGAEATLTSWEPTSSRFAPPRVTGIWSVAGVLRPFFVLDQLGVGSLSELALGYQAKGPLRYQLLVSPVAFSSADDGSALSALALGLVSFDTRLFEIGLGVGVQTVNDSDHEPGWALSLSQSLRFGALDGLHVSIRNDVSLFHGKFEYSAFNGEAQIPVSERGWMVLQGGGGTVGFGFFELGGKVLAIGNGTPGSVFLRGTIGYATVYQTSNQSVFDATTGFADGDVDHAGPLVGLGIEWRR
jgi:hypothetical protein